MPREGREGCEGRIFPSPPSPPSRATTFIRWPGISKIAKGALNPLNMRASTVAE